jgi:hypothetical protein
MFLCYGMTDEVDLHLILQEEETRIRRLRVHSTLKRFLHIHNSNSDIKDKHHKPKSQNEIFVLNSSELKLSIEEKLERAEQLKM